MVSPYISTNNFNVPNGWNAWIAQIGNGLPTEIVEESIITNPKIYPNPVTDIFSIEFESVKSPVTNLNLSFLN